MTNENRLNPDIRQQDVGTKEIRTISIYPLSLQDQIDLVKMLADVINEFGSGISFDDITTNETLDYVQQFLTQNIEKILEFVTSEEERPKINDLTNAQMVAIVGDIFEVNFEAPVKNSMSLFQRGKQMMDQKSQRKRKK